MVGQVGWLGCWLGCKLKIFFWVKMINSFIIFTNESKEEHFKTALKAFDPESIIIIRNQNKFEIKTKLFNMDLITWSSVKAIRQLIIYPKKIIIKKEENGLFSDSLVK